jgi:hypothetical protein
MGSRVKLQDSNLEPPMSAMEGARPQYVRFTPQKGAGEALHKLRDLRLIWGNFPSRSREMKLISQGKQLGIIPATNLIRLSPGTNVRFGGRHWRVRRVLPDSIELESSNSTTGLEITYGGTVGAMDPTAVEEMLRVIESGRDGCPLDAGASKLFTEQAKRMQDCIGWDKLPIACDCHGSYYHLTFAGSLINNVIARWVRLQSYKADDIVLRTDRQLDLSNLPTDPRTLSDTAALVLQVPEELTIFQNALPNVLLVRELRDIWLKAPVYQRSLKRLSRARVVNVELADVAALLN